jgi:hypothetical protein
LSVTSIAVSAFTSLENLKSIDMPGVLAIEGKESSSDSTSGAFAKCTALTSVSLPKVKTLGKYTFYGCSALTSISLPDATDIGESVFSTCGVLSSLSLPKVKTIGGSAFRYCGSLTSISLPEVTFIGSQMFYSGTKLSSITLGSEPPELEGKQVFNSSLTVIYVPASALDTYKNTAKENWTDALKAKVTAKS